MPEFLGIVKLQKLWLSLGLMIFTVADQELLKIAHFFKNFLWLLLSELQVKMMILKVIARTIGLHRLLLLNFYPYLQKYAQVLF